MNNEQLTDIVRRYGNYLSDYLRRGVSNRQDCEDILQEAWLILASRGPENIDSKSLCGYLRCVVMSAKDEYYRRCSRSVYTRNVPDYEFERSEPSSYNYSVFEREFLTMAVKGASKGLSVKNRRYVLEYFIKEKSLTEIAYYNNVCIEAVRKPITDFMPILRKYYKQYV